MVNGNNMKKIKPYFKRLNKVCKCGCDEVLSNTFCPDIDDLDGNKLKKYIKHNPRSDGSVYEISKI
jgi:hypothetical protein